MNNLKKIITGITLLALVFILTSCGAKENQKTTKIKVGASPVPHAQILEFVKEDLKKEGIELEIVEFTDYVLPNTNLDEGELFANFFQHLPYLETFNAEHGTKLSSLGPVHIEPLVVYSEKIKTAADLKEGAKIAIPNDPSNEGRALMLLESRGLIKLGKRDDLNFTPVDIVENNLKFEFVELEAAQIPRILGEVDAAVINTNYALEAKLEKEKQITDNEDAVFAEKSDSVYANIVAVRTADKDSEIGVKLLAALQSEKVRDFINEKYGGAVLHKTQ